MENIINDSESLYSQLGGEPVLHRFVNDLYDFMANSSEVVHIRKMHSENLSHASERLFKFLSGMLGGPPLYMEEFGHPRLRRKHLRFSIGDVERDQWLMCAQYAANQLHIETDVRKQLMNELTNMANHLRNKSESTESCVNAGEHE